MKDSQILTLFEGVVHVQQREVVPIYVCKSHLGLVCSLLGLIRAHKALRYCSENGETDPAPPQPRMTAGEGGYGPNIKPHPPHRAKGTGPPGLLNTLLQPPKGSYTRLEPQPPTFPPVKSTRPPVSTKKMITSKKVPSLDGILDIFDTNQSVSKLTSLYLGGAMEGCGSNIALLSVMTTA